MWVIVRREVHTSIPYIYICEGRFHYNTICTTFIRREQGVDRHDARHRFNCACM
jgi:hypothetical protein